ncbi:MAGUK p55 subfamily member 7 [Patella vulgata]|uniref:MAGUK p55 subfamily member 7 n=1 Tax=Patella vulgata TaxID=6465 RepID=UPI00217FE66D|nr:MAGUK p55 subfamily member 7 [Patella vulgata]
MPVTLPLMTKVPSDPDAQKLLTALPSLEARLPGKEHAVAFLRRFLRSKDLHRTIYIYRKLVQLTTMRTSADFAVSQAADVFCSIRYVTDNPLVQELLQILSRPHLQALLYCYDKVTNHDFEPKIDPIPLNVDEDEAAVKIVRLIKNNEPLGATIAVKDDDEGTIEVARVLHGGAADRSGLINVGDEVHEINGVCVRGLTPDEVVDILSRITGPVTLKLTPSLKATLQGSRECKTRVKALFDYSPEDDSTIPCPEAGLAFTRGEILHIVSQDDSTWWQARKHGDTKNRAGIIPSKQLQERREMLRRLAAKAEAERSETRPISPCHNSPRIPRQKRLRKTMYHAIQNGEYDTDAVPTYEEVELYQVKPYALRPVILVGPPGVGRNELKRRLKASNPGHFEEVLPHTSRPIRPFEIDGKEYRFISREEMEADILAQRYAEYGEYKGNLYGTHIDSIQAVINAKKVCLLTPHTQALKLMRTSDIKPYIIYIRPPSLECLQATRSVSLARCTNSDTDDTKLFTTEELQDMIDSGHKLEERFGHLFDYVIVNADLTDALRELILITNKIEKEPQWVPIGWCQ